MLISAFQINRAKYGKNERGKMKKILIQLYNFLSTHFSSTWHITINYAHARSDNTTERLEYPMRIYSPNHKYKCYVRLFSFIFSGLTPVSYYFKD